MKSLSVIYKNSSSVWAACKLEKKKALLLLDHCPAYPSVDVLKLKDGNIRATFLPNNSTALIQHMDHGIIRVFKTYYHSELLSGVVNSGLKIRECLKILMLKDVADNVSLT
jgi:hypothetical protein